MGVCVCVLVCLCECKWLQGQVTALSPSSSPSLVVCLKFIPLLYLGRVISFSPRCVTILLNHPTTWQLLEEKKKRMLRANRINAMLDGPGHLTNTDALKGAHRMICDWTKNWRDGAWAWPQDWYNMSSTGRAISSAYWKRRILPSAEGNFQCQAPVPLLWLSQACLPFWGDYATFQAHVRVWHFWGAQRAENS